MSLENPFSKKSILPPEETNPDSNIALIGALLGADSAEAYRKTIAGEATKPQKEKPEFNLDAFDDQAFEQHNQVEQGEAEALFGENFLGSKDIENTFGFQIETKDIPPIPFTRQELKDAKEKRQTLRLTWDTLSDGTKLSGAKMIELRENKQSNGKSLFYDANSYKDENFFKNETPRRGWVITSIGVRHFYDSYLQQIDSLIEEYPDTPVYQKAIQAYEKQKPCIRKLWENRPNKNWQEVSKILGTLEITSLTRDSFSEYFQQMIVHNQKTGKSIFDETSFWTNSLSSKGLVYVRYFDFNGFGATTSDPYNSYAKVGVHSSYRKI